MDIKVGDLVRMIPHTPTANGLTSRCLEAMYYFPLQKNQVYVVYHVTEEYVFVFHDVECSKLPHARIPKANLEIVTV